MDRESPARVVALFDGAREPIRELWSDRLSFGCAADCDVRLSAASVAPHAGELRRIQSTWVWLDQANGAGPTAAAQRSGRSLHDGDLIDIGPYRFRFEFSASDALPHEAGSQRTQLDSLVAARLPHDLRASARLAPKVADQPASDPSSGDADSDAVRRPDPAADANGAFTLAERLDDDPTTVDALRLRARAEMAEVLALRRQLAAEQVQLHAQRAALDRRQAAATEQQSEAAAQAWRLGQLADRLELREAELNRRTAEACANDERIGLRRAALESAEQELLIRQQSLVEREALLRDQCQQLLTRSRELDAMSEAAAASVAGAARAPAEMLENDALSRREFELEQRADELQRLAQRLAEDDAELRRRMEAYEHGVGALLRADHSARPGVAAAERAALIGDLDEMPGGADDAAPLASDPAGQSTSSVRPAHVRAEAPRPAGHSDPNAAPAATAHDPAIAAERPQFAHNPPMPLKRAGVGRAAMALAAMTTIAAALTGYWWPSPSAEVYAELCLTAPVEQPRPILARHMAGLGEPAVFDEAADQANGPADLLAAFRRDGAIGITLDMARSRIRLSLRAPAQQAADARRWLDALLATYCRRQEALKPPVTTESLKQLETERTAAAERCAQRDEAAGRLSGELGDSALDDQLQRARANLRDVESMLARARDDADRARQDHERLKNDADDSVARTPAPEALADALAADAMLNADREQLAAQSVAWHSDIRTAVAAVSDGLESLSLAAGAGRARIGELRARGEHDEDHEALTVFAAALDQFDVLLQKAFDQWTTPAAMLHDWNTSGNVTELELLQTRLSEAAMSWTTELQATHDHLAGVARGLPASQDAAADTRRRVMQSALQDVAATLDGGMTALRGAIVRLSAEGESGASELRRLVQAMTQRVKDRESAIRAAVAEQARLEWKSRRTERLAAAQRHDEAAAAQRDSMMRDVDAAQRRVSQLLEAVQRREARRRESSLRQTEAADARAALTAIDQRIENVRQDLARAAAAELFATPAIVLPASPEERFSRAATFGGITAGAALFGLMVLSFVSVSDRRDRG